MASEKTTLKATCLCGSAKHEITLLPSQLPLQLHFCHCNSCRHMTGALALTEVTLPSGYKPAKELLEKLTAFSFSKRITQYHCNTCGSQMLAQCWVDGNDPDKGYSWDVMSGTLEQAEGVVEVTLHEHIQDTLDGGFADFLPSISGKTIERWAASPNSKDQLPLYWTSPEQPQIEPSSSDRLHCHCKCGGVEFWITRPSERSKKAACTWPDVLIPYHSKEPRTAGATWWLRDNGKRFLGGVCSCNSCRLDTGMEYVEWAFVPTIDMTLDAAGKIPFQVPFGTLKLYNSSPDVSRYHCSVCGATVFFNSDSRTELFDVAAGLLDAPEGARAESWLEWTTKRLSFREDAIPRAKSLTLAVEAGLRAFGERHKQ